MRLLRAAVLLGLAHGALVAGEARSLAAEEPEADLIVMEMAAQFTAANHNFHKQGSSGIDGRAGRARQRQLRSAMVDDRPDREHKRELQDSHGNETTVHLQLLTTVSAYIETSGGTGERVALGSVYDSIAAALVVAAEHCEARNGSIVAGLGQEAMAGCEDLRFNYSLWDTRCEPGVAVQAYLQDFERTNVVVGPIKSAEAIPISIISGSHDIPILSFWSTSPELAQKDLYPHFSRTIPSDAATAVAAAGLFREYGLEHVGMLFVDSSYGTNLEALVRKRSAELGIRLWSGNFVRGNATTVDFGIRRLMKLRLNVIFVVVEPNDLEVVLGRLHAAGLAGPGRLLIFSDSVTVDVLSALVAKNASFGEVLNGTQQVSAVGGDASNAAFARLRDAWPGFASHAHVVNDHLPGGARASTVADLGPSFEPDGDFAVQIDPDSFFQDTVPLISDIVPFAYDAVAAACRAACISYGGGTGGGEVVTPPESEAAEAGEAADAGDAGAASAGGDAGDAGDDDDGSSRPPCMQGERLSAVLRSPELVFEGASGTVQLDSVTGDRRLGSAFIQVRNFFVDASESDDGGRRVRLREAGRWVDDARWELDATALVFPPGDVGSPPVDVDASPHDMNVLTGGQRAVGLAVAAAVLALCAGFAAWILANRQHRVVRKSQPTFLLIFLGGVAVSTLAIVPLTLDDAASAHPSRACNAVLWLLSVGVTISVTGLLTKLYRIKRIFGDRNLRSLMLKSSELYRVIAVVVALNVVLLLASTLLNPLQYERTVIDTDVFGRPVSSFGSCNVQDRTQAIVFGVLLVLMHVTMYAYGGYLSYKVRRVDIEFQEGAFLSAAVVFQAQLYLLAAPVYLAIDDAETSLRYFLVLLVIALSNLVSTLLIMAPKVVFAKRRTVLEKKKSLAEAEAEENPESDHGDDQQGAEVEEVEEAEEAEEAEIHEADAGETKLLAQHQSYLSAKPTELFVV